MLQIRLLSIIQILQQCSRCQKSRREFFDTKSDQRIYLKMLHKDPSAPVIIEHMGFQCIDGDMQTGL